MLNQVWVMSEAEKFANIPSLAHTADQGFIEQHVLSIAREYRHNGKLSQAITQCHDAIIMCPVMSSPHILLADIYEIDFADYDQAIVHYKEALRLEPTNTVVRNNYAMMLDEQLNRPEEALYHYQQALELDPALTSQRGGVRVKSYTSLHQGLPKHIADVHNNMGLLLETRKRDFSNALRHYRRAIAVNRRHVQAHTNLGLLLAREPFDMVEEALGHLRTAVLIDPTEPTVHYNLAVMLHERSTEFDEAFSHYVVSLELDVQQADCHYYIARLCHHHYGQIEVARQHYKEALLLDGNHVCARIGLALISEHHDGNYVTAVRLYAEAIALNTLLIEPRYHLARLHLRVGNIHLCLEQLTHLLLLEEPTAELHNHIGVCFARTDRNQALSHLRSALNLEPNNPIVHYNLACLYRSPALEVLGGKTSDDDLRRAVFHFSKALEHSPEDPEVLANLAELHYVMHPHDIDQPEKLYARAITQCPHLARASHGLALMLFAEGRFFEALEKCHAANLTDPSNPYVYRTMSRILRTVIGNGEAAIKYALASLVYEPTHKETYIQLLMCFMESGDYRQSLKWAQRLRHMYPDEPCSALLETLIVNEDLFL